MTFWLVKYYNLKNYLEISVKPNFLSKKMHINK